MISIVFMLLLAVIAAVTAFVKFPAEIGKLKKPLTSMLAAVSLLVGLSGAVEYNKAGYQTHIQTIFGWESAKMSPGWYFSGWGPTKAWPQYLTVANTDDPTMEGSSISGPYKVRLADNWMGAVTQTTRFGIPQDREQFLAMHRKYRSPERLIQSTLKPAVTSSLDSVANMFSMEDYYAGGQRDQFKTEYENAIKKGRARVRQVEIVTISDVEATKSSASDSPYAQDTSDGGESMIRRFKMEKVLDSQGNVSRVDHDYMTVGVFAASAILENIDPDDDFEIQIKKRKDAAARRVIAKEQRLEQEEQRLLAIQEGSTRKAKEKADAEVIQTQQTIAAETQKKLAITQAERQREEARIAKQTAELNLEKARIDAEAVTVAAEAEAYAKNAILEADGALQQKLDAWVESQRVWADAASKINVPATVIGGGESSGSALGTVDQFMSMMMIKTAKDLQVDPNINK